MLFFSKLKNQLFFLNVSLFIEFTSAYTEIMNLTNDICVCLSINVVIAYYHR